MENKDKIIGPVTPAIVRELADFVMSEYEKRCDNNEHLEFADQLEQIFSDKSIQQLTNEINANIDHLKVLGGANNEYAMANNFQEGYDRRNDQHGNPLGKGARVYLGVKTAVGGLCGAELTRLDVKNQTLGATKRKAGITLDMGSPLTQELQNKIEGAYKQWQLTQRKAGVEK